MALFLFSVIGGCEREYTTVLLSTVSLCNDRHAPESLIATLGNQREVIGISVGNGRWNAGYCGDRFVLVEILEGPIALDRLDGSALGACPCEAPRNA